MRIMLRNVLAFAFAIAAATSVAISAPRAWEWPNRPVKLLLPLGPGSGSDIAARLLADRLSKRWGQPVIVENRPGGDAVVAINAFVTAHDDHVLLFSPTSSFTAHVYLHDNLPYKMSDLVPITRVSNTIIAISVPVSLHIDTFKQLVERARAEPGKLNWAGVTGALDFMFEGWLKREGLNITKVPYRNPVDAASDLAEGRVQVYESALAIVRPQLEAGKIKPLAVTNTARAPNMPDLPTVRDLGYPALTLDGLVGLFGPTGMAPDLRQHITDDIRAVADTTVEERLAVTGQLLNVGGPEDFAKSIEQQRAAVAAFAEELGIKALQ
jgi:tripartite-type tricarboxylate transporter receptor subunit TctC